MKKILIIIGIVVILLIAFVFYIVYTNYKMKQGYGACFELVERENLFCSTLSTEQCRFYQNSSNNIPDGGHCYWNEEALSCSGATRGCN